MPPLEQWLLAAVIALLVGAWHAADAARRDRAARKSFPSRPDAVAGKPPA